MIRRDDRRDWLIIPQVEHARLAGELARVWGNDRVASLDAFPKLGWGVAHHDDGWREWDEAPRLNPATGFPRSFLEMRMRESTDIWTKSIAVCAADPLAGIAVSRHFCYLAKQAQNSGRSDADDRESCARFIREQSAMQAELMLAARSAGTNGDFEESCDFGFRVVRFFDLVSLWLCCAERRQPEQLAGPRGEALELSPIDSDYIVMEPYCLGVDSLRLETAARRLAARRYENDAELQAALRAAPTEVLAWTIGRT